MSRHRRTRSGLLARLRSAAPRTPRTTLAALLVAALSAVLFLAPATSGASRPPRSTAAGIIPGLAR